MGRHFFLLWLEPTVADATAPIGTRVHGHALLPPIGEEPELGLGNAVIEHGRHIDAEGGEIKAAKRAGR